MRKGRPREVGRRFRSTPFRKTFISDVEILLRRAAATSDLEKRLPGSDNKCAKAGRGKWGDGSDRPPSGKHSSRMSKSSFGGLLQLQIWRNACLGQIINAQRPAAGSGETVQIDPLQENIHLGCRNPPSAGCCNFRSGETLAWVR